MRCSALPVIATCLLALSSLGRHCCQGCSVSEPFALHYISRALRKKGTIHMAVSPYPARVYQNAPAGVPVLRVRAEDEGTPLTTFNLERRGLSDYFSVDSSGLLLTAKRIDRTVGFKFHFFVFAVSLGSTAMEWKHVIIEVTEKNLHPPIFSQDIYNTSVYRFSPEGIVITTLSAVDRDPEPYNRDLTFLASSSQLSPPYVNVTSLGDVILAKPVPDDVSVLNMTVSVVDAGSPQLTGTAVVTVTVDDVKEPDTFCVSTTLTDATLCWKNPMPGRSSSGYNVSVRGQDFTFHQHLLGDRKSEEFCTLIPGLTLNETYTFRVTLDTPVKASAPEVEVTFENLGQGFSLECVEKSFAACHYLLPCENGARCVMGEGGGLNYTCDCPSGWQGHDCTQKDLCAVLPCQNNGQCVYAGHERYACNCQPAYFGDICQHFNVCMAGQTCQNGGVCRMYDNGTHFCQCPHYFTGSDCSDPDPCWPSPCGEGGACVKVSGTEANCSCFPGYYGERCEHVDLCQVDTPCRNGGTCLTLDDRSVRCHCPPQFTGALCELYDACPLACENNSTCHVPPNGSYNCTCLPGFYGNECQHYNRCHSNPCHNGSCNPEETVPLCDCQPGFSGILCEQYHPCLTEPCHGHGVCVELKEGERGEEEDPYECQCYESWWGARCQFPNTCHIGVCKNGATCHNHPPASFRCECPTGYYSGDCSRFNPCEGEELCHNGGTCLNTSISTFRCQCVEGHFGEHCQYTDPCLSSPCLHSGHCHNHTNNNYSCSCTTGFHGDRCQFSDHCEQLPCLNGGSCIRDLLSGSARCQCPAGFGGYFCQVPDVCLAGRTGHGELWCQSGSCEHVNTTLLREWKEDVQDLAKFFRCRCGAGYTGTRCEISVSDCPDIRCQNNGECQRGVCVCPSPFTGLRCESSLSACDPDPCPQGLRCQATGTATNRCVCQNGWSPPDCLPACEAEISESRTTGRFQWPRTLAGETALMTCPYGSHDVSSQNAIRHCSLDGHGAALWERLDDSSCRQLDLHEVSRRLSILKEMTSDPAGFDPSEVNHVTSALEDLYVFSLMDRQVAFTMVNVISNLCDVNVSVMVSSNQENKTSDRLVTLLEDYSAEVTLGESENITWTSANIEVFVARVGNRTSSFAYVPSVTVGKITTQMNVSIDIPPEVFMAGNTSQRQGSRLQLIGYRTSRLFIPEGWAYDNTESEHQRVVSAIVTGKQVVDLSSPVLIRMRNLQPARKYICVYWDNEHHTWSTEGMKTFRKSDNITECQSSHLTSFAILLDPTPEYRLGGVQEKVLTFISYIGSAVSLLCLSLTILTYSLFRSLSQEKSGQILLHLCLALLLLNVFFLANASVSSGSHHNLDDDNAACMAVAVLLHFFLLSSLGWMVVEAVEMYQAVIIVFIQYTRCYLLKRCLVAWGLPVVIVAITAAVDTANYRSDTGFCFISSANPGAYYGSVIAPACVVLVVNTVIFVRVTLVLFTHRSPRHKHKSGPVTPSQVRGAFTVMVLLGISWVFGPLAIRDARVVFNYLFCILNSFQGFLIFVFRCLFNPEVRLCWRQLLKTGTLKKRRGPSPSHGHSDTGLKGDVTPTKGSHCKSSSGSTSSSAIHSDLKDSTVNGWHLNISGLSGSSGCEGGNGAVTGAEACQDNSLSVFPFSASKTDRPRAHTDTRGKLHTTSAGQPQTEREERVGGGGVMTSQDLHAGSIATDYSQSAEANRQTDENHVTDRQEVRKRSVESGPCDIVDHLSVSKNEWDEITSL